MLTKSKLFDLLASFRNCSTFDDLNSCKVFWQSNTDVDVDTIISYTQNVLQLEAEQRKNKEQRRKKFLSHSKPGSRTEKAVKFECVRNVGCARTDKSCSASGAPGDKTFGRLIRDSYRHLSTKFTTCKDVCMSAKKDGKTASVKHTQFFSIDDK